jgi:long-chain acyl-CoA synthetase
MSREKELSYILSDSRAKVLICLEDLYDTVAKHCITPQIACVITTTPLDFLRMNLPTTLTYLANGAVSRYPKIFSTVQRIRLQHHTDKVTDFMTALQDNFSLSATRSHPPAIDFAPDDIAMLTYTSGTTGPPKGTFLFSSNFLRVHFSGSFPFPSPSPLSFP